MASIERKRTKADQRREKQRLLLFGDVPKADLWSHSHNGWCWTPRTMPLVLHAIRALSKGTSAAETYFALWCHCISESLVEMRDRASLISASGYSGATSERMWRERMRKLEELGFIRVASGVHGDISSVLILNPHKVLRRLKESRTPGFDDRIYNCILEEMSEYGMADFDESDTPRRDRPPQGTADTGGAQPPSVPAEKESILPTRMKLPRAQEPQRPDKK